VVRRPVDVLGRRQQVTGSIGLSTCTGQETVDVLLRDADVALSRAKDAGRDRFAWFDARAHRELVDKVALEADLRHALARGGLDLHFQPLFALPGLRPMGVEALSRWRDPTRGDVPPADFIPLAEDTGLVWQLTERVVEQACAQAVRWSHVPDFTVWVNISPVQFNSPGVADMLSSALKATGVPADRLGVEVTESVLIDEASARRELEQLASAGVKIAVDDFGTGYSSLARLGSLPIDVLKIDRSFVSRAHTPAGADAVAAVVQLGHALGLRTVAEGVETRDQLRAVTAAGAEAASGFLLGRPAEGHQLELWLPAVTRA